MLRYPATPRVQTVNCCELAVGPGVWDYALAHQAGIETDWTTAQARQPNFFNGTIHLVDALRIDGGTLTARLLQTDFKSYLHWRQAGYPETGVCDGFGSALLQARDGAVLLGRQRSGNINAGLAYLPGGFIDGRDVADDGSIDIEASIARELEEETGLTALDVVRAPGFLITQSHAQLSFAVRYTSALAAADLKARIERHIATDANSELADMVVVRRADDMVGLAMPPYARALLQSFMPA